MVIRAHQRMPCRRRVVLLTTLAAALLAHGGAEARVDRRPPPPPDTGEIDFAIHARDSLRIEARTVVKGGAVGTAALAPTGPRDLPPDGHQVVILGATVGDVYGESVLLDENARAHGISSSAQTEIFMLQAGSMPVFDVTMGQQGHSSIVLLR